jgi:predicted dehydrogenase
MGAVLANSPLTRAQTRPGTKTVSVGFIGVGDRGTALLKVLLVHPNVRVPAICDIDEKHLDRALDLVEKAYGKRPEGYSKGEDDYRRLLGRDDLDAVLIATPQELHARMAIDSFDAGKFVGSEVPACCTLEECRNLVQAQKRTSAGYMMLENYLYSRATMQVGNMIEHGLFGDPTYGFGAYIHDLRSMRFNSDGTLTWRGENVLHQPGIVYPTHAIGPICRWMGINRGDRLKTLVAMDCRAVSNHLWAEKHFGRDSAPAKVNFENGDTSQALIRTANGALIEVRYDTASVRPPAMSWHSVQGTRGLYTSDGPRSVYLEGVSPHETWELLEKYQDQYEHPYWKQHGDEASKTGHGGGDYFVIADFLQAIRTGQSPIDVVDAATWSAIRPLSEQSIREGYKPVEAPDFARI